MKKMNILNTMTRAGVRHAVYSPVRSHSILMFSMDEDESAVVSFIYHHSLGTVSKVQFVY